MTGIDAIRAAAARARGIRRTPLLEAAGLDRLATLSGDRDRAEAALDLIRDGLGRSGAAAEGRLRFCYAVAEETIDLALSRLGARLPELARGARR